MTRRVLVVGGGTAGHVFPAMAVARVLESMVPVIEPVFVGTRERLEGRLVPAAGFPLHHIDALPLPRHLSLSLARLPFALRRSVRACMQVAENQECVGAITFGGYVSFPVAAAAHRLGIPLVLHEQNSVPGVANRFAARWADRIAVTFPGSADAFRYSERAAVTGNPVREEILASEALDPEEARQRFGLQPSRRTLLIFGGSQGARRINRAAVESASKWPGRGKLQILHAAGGPLHREAAAGWEHARRGTRLPVRCVDFIEDMAAAYAAADVVVCRAGATTIAELTVLGKPAVLIPYPHATGDHQLHNGRALEHVGAAVVVEDQELDGDSLVAAAAPLLTDDTRRAEVAAAARAFGRRDAAESVARLMVDLLPGRE